VKRSVVEAVRDAVDTDCLVALGGGADSAALVWAAAEVLGPDRVQAAFVYHGLEGSDALRDAALATCDVTGVQCTVLERLVPDGGNLEARARAERYAALESLLEDGNIALTGHSADDQAETVLMRLLRGSGARGLAGIPHRRGPWRRPLLGFSRETLRSIALDLGLPFFDDPANTDRRFMRTRMRHVLMPVIDEEFGPDVRDRILRSAVLVAADDEALECEARKVSIMTVPEGVSIPLGPMVTLPDPIASRVARRALRNVLGGDPGSASDIEAVLSVARGAPAATISGALQVVKNSPYVCILRLGDWVVPDEMKIHIGETFDWSGTEYSTRITDVPPPAIVGGRFTLLDEEFVGDSARIRGFQPGDRIEIETGASPVKEVLRVAGVHERLRPYSPVTTVEGRIAAIIGLRVATWARPRIGRPTIIIEREVGTWK
jgi:tRNA(Ile)-lysidine synthase